MSILAYAPGESYTDLPSVALRKAFLDPAMLAPSGLVLPTVTSGPLTAVSGNYLVPIVGSALVNSIQNGSTIRISDENIQGPGHGPIHTLQGVVLSGGGVLGSTTLVVSPTSSSQPLSIVLGATVIVLASELLFPSEVFSIRLGGDEGIIDSRQTVTTPIPGIVITIGTEFGIEYGYAGDTSKDSLLWLPFTVWANTEEDQDDSRKRLLFARDNRANVFATYGLTLFFGMVPTRPRAPSPITGLHCTDYRWRFLYSRP